MKGRSGMGDWPTLNIIFIILPPFPSEKWLSVKHLSRMSLTAYDFKNNIVKYKEKTDIVGSLKRKGMVYSGELKFIHVVARFNSFLFHLLLNSIPLYGYTTICLPIHLFMQNCRIQGQCTKIGCISVH